jgi:hypothetical protein
MMEQMDYLVLDQYIIRSFALYNENTADDVLLDFIKELSTQDK